MYELRVIRRGLRITLTDVSDVVGIAATKLSQAERGLVQLTPRERAAVEKFLHERLACFESEVDA